MWGEFCNVYDLNTKDEPNEEVKKRVVKSKCMADMLVWLGFEYEKGEEGYIFKRTYMFDRAWKDIHSLRQFYRR